MAKIRMTKEEGDFKRKDAQENPKRQDTQDDDKREMNKRKILRTRGKLRKKLHHRGIAKRLVQQVVKTTLNHLAVGEKHGKIAKH